MNWFLNWFLLVLVNLFEQITNCHKNVNCIHTLFYKRKFWWRKTDLSHNFYIILLIMNKFNKYLNYSIFHAVSKVPALLFDFWCLFFSAVHLVFRYEHQPKWPLPSVGPASSLLKQGLDKVVIKICCTNTRWYSFFVETAFILFLIDITQFSTINAYQRVHYCHFFLLVYIDSAKQVIWP